MKVSALSWWQRSTLCLERSLVARTGFRHILAWHRSLEFVALPLGDSRIRSLFIELPKIVRVLAVAHERRRPGYWVGRLKEA